MESVLRNIAPNGIIPNELQIEQNRKGLNKTVNEVSTYVNESKDVFMQMKNLLAEISNSWRLEQLLKFRSGVHKIIYYLFLSSSMVGGEFLFLRLLYIYFGAFANSYEAYKIFNDPKYISLALLFAFLSPLAIVFKKIWINCIFMINKLTKKVADDLAEINKLREEYTNLKVTYKKYWETLGEDWLNVESLRIINESLQKNEFETWGDILEDCNLKMRSKKIIDMKNINIVDAETRFSIKMIDNLMKETDWLDDKIYEIQKAISGFEHEKITKKK